MAIWIVIVCTSIHVLYEVYTRIVFIKIVLFLSKLSANYFCIQKLDHEHKGFIAKEEFIAYYLKARIALSLIIFNFYNLIKSSNIILYCKFWSTIQLKKVLRIFLVIRVFEPSYLEIFKETNTENTLIDFSRII